jgi:hypothetical protein
MKPIDSAWTILKQPETMGEMPMGGGSGAQSYLTPGGQAVGQAGPFMFNIGRGGGGRPSTASLLHGLATRQAPRGAKRALAGRALGTGLGAVNALLAAERAQRGGDIESALGAAYAGYQVPKQGVVGATEGEWGQKPILDARGRSMLDEETGEPRLQQEATPGGAIGGSMEARDLFNRYRGKPMDAELLPDMPVYGQSQPPKQLEPPRTAPTLGEIAAQRHKKDYGDVAPVQTEVPVGDSSASQRLAELRQEIPSDYFGGQEASVVPPITSDTQVTGQGMFPGFIPPNNVEMSEPMDLAFRMLKGVMI